MPDSIAVPVPKIPKKCGENCAARGGRCCQKLGTMFLAAHECLPDGTPLDGQPSRVIEHLRQEDFERRCVIPSGLLLK